MTEQGITAAEQLAALGQAVVATDVEGVVVAWNPAAETLYGWTAEEAIGRDLTDMFVPDMAHDVAEEIMDALRAGIAWTGGFPVRRKDGSLFAALVTDSGIYRDGTLVGLVGISTNLGTALRPMLERAADAALMLRPDGTITYASPAVHQLFGWQEEELVGTSFAPLLHPDDRTAMAVFLEDLVRQPGARPALEVRVRRGNGWAWAEAAFTNFLDDPLVRGVVCNLRRSLAHSEGQTARQRIEDLEVALQSRLAVERAKGYLCGRDGIDDDAAFEMLLEHARAHHVSLHEVAELVLSGELPLGPEAGG